MVKPGERMYVKCPSCATMMNRKLFAAGAGVIVDVCRAHGTFFDAGELPQIIDFVMKGGLEAAQKKEIERERQKLAHEKAMPRSARVGIVRPCRACRCRTTRAAPSSTCCSRCSADRR